MCNTIEVLEQKTSTAYRGIARNQDCWFCGEPKMTIKGYFATGEPLEFYTPEKDELLSNEFAMCSACGEWQAS